MNSYIADVSSGDTAIFDREESRHAVSVMRLKPNEEIYVTDGAGRRFLALAENCDASGVTAKLIKELTWNESHARITVLIGCLKSDKLEFLTQKLTEAGVRAIVPVLMSRCVALPDAEKKTARLEKIAREAVKQSKRSVIPQVFQPTKWKEALQIIKGAQIALMPWEKAETTRINDVFNNNSKAEEIVILIGPEGGITETEAEEAQRAGAVSVTLGPRILRAETAALVSLAIAQSLWGDI